MADISHTRPSPSEFHILLALADAERHGYGIMAEVVERTGGRFRLGPGTLYTAIKRMLSRGWIEASVERPDPQDDQRRRYYRLTSIGHQVLVEEAEYLAGIVRLAREKHLLGLPAESGGTLL